MRSMLIALIAILGIGSTSLAQSQEGEIVLADGTKVLRISVGSNKPSLGNFDLPNRIYRLEMAVAQLQQRIYQLETQPVLPPAPPMPVSFTCTINTGKGMVVGTDKTEKLARVKVIQECFNAPKEKFFYNKEYVCLDQYAACEANFQ